MKKVFIIIGVLLFYMNLQAAEKITGIWKIISKETGFVQSIALIYEYNSKVFGRLLVTYEDDGKLSDPKGVADKIVGDPTFIGLDFIWDLEDRGKKWSRGKILDPLRGKIYSCDMWIDGDNLIVKGKIGPFGREQIWIPLKKRSELPSWVKIPNKPTPIIPVVK
ncbi:DUF2147 domain-containing protein [Thiospirochaeta perfilievii]|uniref:DUF2147 domain-containing protein n=1 Tax=Thiospirochaeta perfilievii TaxID=252967 RepID=A0A5C1QAK1_9SPIO|nr:DUF2147 domain-containing protein [Thiospirochaeta perfilievii]QEN05085.1 DUF2147 domain-containing protein [Thiospirochaeta perfilievii]